MLQVEIGRAIMFAKEENRGTVAVITNIQDTNFVIIQEALTKTRKRFSLKQIILLPIVLDISIEMKPDEVEKKIVENGLVAQYQETPQYKEYAKKIAYKNATDFERFKMDLQSQIETEVLKEKNLI